MELDGDMPHLYPHTKFESSKENAFKRYCTLKIVYIGKRLPGLKYSKASHSLEKKIFKAKVGMVIEEIYMHYIPVYDP